MKTCFNNAELAHVWLNLTDAELDGERMGNGSNFRFIGPACYSYQTQIAHIYRNKAGARLVLIDSHSFSMSTQRQQSCLRRAMRPSDLNISAPFGIRGQYLPREGLAVWEACKAAALSCVERASKARSNGPYLWGAAEGYITDVEKVRAFFKLRNKPFAPDLSALAAKVKEEAKKSAAREKAKAERRARLVSGFAPRVLALWREHGEGSLGWEEIRNECAKVGLRSLPMGELVSTPDFAATAALRLSSDGSRVETSQGAQVLVRTVRFLWAFCRNARATGTALDRETLRRFPRLDNYNASAIDAGGNLTAGCHRIPFAEVQEIARALKLPPFNGELPQAPTIPAEEVSA